MASLQALASARSRSMLEFFERRRADHAKIARGQQRFEQRRQIHRAAGDRAGADRECISSMKRIGLGALQCGDDGLEALFSRPDTAFREQRARIERKYRIFQCPAPS